MTYFPNTDGQIKEMLEAIGVERYEELLEGIPEVLGTDQKLDLPPALSEMELLAEVKEIAAKNDAVSPSFLGPGGG